jgi:UDP-N-acetylglucosamine 2-epimerase (non-hydrolysing)
MADISQRMPVVFPVHPRTRSRIRELNMELPNGSLRFIEPLGYLDFLAMMKSAALVVTDSGGVQEETTFLGVPCLTARPNTERPITICEGTNRLVDSRYEDLVEAMNQSLDHEPSTPTRRPELWDDGLAARRIADVMCNL